MQSPGSRRSGRLTGADDKPHSYGTTFRVAARRSMFWRRPTAIGHHRALQLWTRRTESLSSPVPVKESVAVLRWAWLLLAGM